MRVCMHVRTYVCSLIRPYVRTLICPLTYNIAERTTSPFLNFSLNDLVNWCTSVPANFLPVAGDKFANLMGNNKPCPQISMNHQQATIRSHGHITMIINLNLRYIICSFMKNSVYDQVHTLTF